MADPICRWRNPSVETVIELINLLPKEELFKNQAREIVKQKSLRYDFYKTPYQLACQLGLYHETNDRYFPKFTYSPTEEEVNRYLTNWIIHYCIANPYTRGFEDLEPFSIHAEICKKLYESQSPSNWELIKSEIFRNDIGNNDILINAINSYSPIITINKGIVALKENKKYAELVPYINVDISLERNNKEYFFDLFTVSNPKENSVQNNLDQFTTEISQTDIDLIHQIQNIPNLSQTVKNQIIRARIGQGYFRRSLLLECGYCPIILVNEPNFLIASHIKPWRDSSNKERLDVKNGLLFTPTFDKLFDGGYISFNNRKEMLISSLISSETKQRFNIQDGQIYGNLPLTGREFYLEYHRSEIFKK